MDRNKFYGVVFCLFFAGSLLAQDRYMVFFMDKANTNFSTSSPLEFLSQRALDRREKHGVSVTEEDLPVNSSYVQELNATGAQVYFTSKWMNAALVEMLPTLEPTVLGLPSVESIEYVAPGSKLSFTEDVFSIAETFTVPSTVAASTDVQVQMIGADRLHSDGFDGDGILIAVFDGGFTGVNMNSPFQQIHDEGRILATLDFVENTGNPYQYSDHGTQVLSCIAGVYSDGATTFIGTAPNADFILAVTEDVATEYRIEEYNWLLAAEYADSAGVDVINCSLGYTTFDDADMDYTYEGMDGETTVITRAASLASSKGMLVVNAAGNSGTSSWHYIGAPADSPSVLAVGAVGADEVMASFSSFGPSFDGRTKPDISAMGLLTTVVNAPGNIVLSNGTSFSSPLVAGLAASLWQAYPDLTNVELMNLIKNSGNQADAPDNELGYGIPNYLTIIEAPLGTSGEFGSFKVYPNPMQWSLTIESLEKTEISYQLENIEGKVVAKGVMKTSETQVEIDPSLESGIYFLQLRSGSNIETIKLLKR